MTEALQAQELFRTAYENRYTWDADFPGYRADLQLIQGDEIYQAKITVNRDLTVEVTGLTDETVKESVYNQLRDIVTHRKRSDFEKAHGKNRFTLGETDPTGAVEILVSGDAMGSNYKVRGSEICQVSRIMGPLAFTINTQESLKTESGYISTGYHAIFRNAKTQALQGKRNFHEVYEKVGDYYLPSLQRIDAIADEGKTLSTEFIFTNLQLLEAPVVSPVS
jgi:hypothetical protein